MAAAACALLGGSAKGAAPAPSTGTGAKAALSLLGGKAPAVAAAAPASAVAVAKAVLPRPPTGDVAKPVLPGPPTVAVAKSVLPGPPTDTLPHGPAASSSVSSALGMLGKSSPPATPALSKTAPVAPTAPAGASAALSVLGKTAPPPVAAAPAAAALSVLGKAPAAPAAPVKAPAAPAAPEGPASPASPAAAAALDVLGKSPATPAAKALGVLGAAPAPVGVAPAAPAAAVAAPAAPPAAASPIVSKSCPPPPGGPYGVGPAPAAPDAPDKVSAALEVLGESATASAPSAPPAAPPAVAPAPATSEMMQKVDEGLLGPFEAEDLRLRLGDGMLMQALSYAIDRGKLKAVLALAEEECEMLREKGEAVKLVSTEELMLEADAGDWASVAYHLARERKTAGDVALRQRHFQYHDPRARQALRRASGACLVTLPYDLCLAYTKTGKVSQDLHVEHPRWLNPKPRKDQRFLLAGDAECSRCRRDEKASCHGHRRGKQLPDGWYSMVQYPLGDAPHLLRKAWLRRKDWRQQDLDLKEQFYVIWHVEWDAVKGEGFSTFSDAERKFDQLLEVYKALNSTMAVTGLLVDSAYREKRFVGLRQEGVMKKLREWWQQHQTAALVARDVGETLLCKAVKAQQWDLVLWILRCNEEGMMSLAQQLEVEWHGLWDDQLWYAQLQNTQDLRSLVEHLDAKATLSRPWLRGGAVFVPTKARLVYPKVDMLKEALALEPLSASIALEALRRVGCNQLCFALASDGRRADLAWRSDLKKLAGEEDTFGRPLLHRAAVAGALEVVQALLEAEADPDGCDEADRSVLANAASAQRWEVCLLLLEHGCSTTGHSGDLAFRAAQRASCQLERSKELSNKEVARAKMSMEVLDLLYTRRERPRAKSLSDFFAKQVRGDVVNGLEPRSFKLEHGMLNHATVAVWSRGLIVGCGLGGVVNEMDWKEPRRVLFAVLDAEAFEAAQKEEALDVGRGLHLLSEEQIMGTGVKAMAISVPLRRLAPVATAEVGTGLPNTPWERQARRNRRAKHDKHDAQAQTVQPESLGGQRFRSMLPVLAWAPPTGTLRVESATSCCQVAIGRVDALADGIRLGETKESEGLAEVEILVPSRELQVSLELSQRSLLHQTLDFRPREEERNVSEDIQVKVPVGIYIYVTPIILEDSKLEPELMVFVCGHRRDIPDDGQPFKGILRWAGGEVRLDAWRPVELGQEDCLQLLTSMRFEPDLPRGRIWSPVEWEDTSTEDCKACQFQRLLINPVRVRTFGQNQQHLGWFIIAFATKD